MYVTKYVYFHPTIHPFSAAYPGWNDGRSSLSRETRPPSACPPPLPLQRSGHASVWRLPLLEPVSA